MFSASRNVGATMETGRDCDGRTLFMMLAFRDPLIVMDSRLRGIPAPDTRTQGSSFAPYKERARS